MLDFLVEAGLLQGTKDNQYRLGVARTHLSAESPFVDCHHRNWRIKVQEFYGNVDEQDIVFTAPLTISKSDFLAFRKDLLKLIENLTVAVDSSQEEEFVIFNLDWLRIK